MPEYDNTNRGVLFLVEEKEDEKHADYSGSINIDGVEHWLSAWRRTSKNGKKFLSLTIKRKPASAKKPATKSGSIADMDDDVPW